MENVFTRILVSLLLFLNSERSDGQSLGPDAFEAGMSGKNVQLLDVRTAAEYRTGHLFGSLQADWTQQEQFRERISYLSKEQSVYIYCLSGGRSTAAAAWMRSEGFRSVVELQGGIQAWKRAGKSVEGQRNQPALTWAQYTTSIPGDRTVLVDVGAPWCPPCVRMKPVIDDLVRKQQPPFHLITIDAGVHTELLSALQIGTIPVFIIYKNGKEVWRKQGVVSREELVNNLK